ISAAHVVALAQEMSLAMTEVYEVATFYHHFDVVKEGETPPPPLTVRVCETLSCQMAGAEALRATLAGACGQGVRVIGAPCIGRCEHAPAAVVGRNPIDRATPEAVLAAIAGRHTEPAASEYIDYDAYRAAGGYATYLACVNGERRVDDVVKTMEDSSLRGLGGRHRRHLRLLARRVRRMPRDSRARDCRSGSGSAEPVAAHPAAPRRGRV